MISRELSRIRLCTFDARTELAFKSAPLIGMMGLEVGTVVVVVEGTGGPD